MFGQHMCLSLAHIWVDSIYRNSSGPVNDQWTTLRAHVIAVCELSVLKESKGCRLSQFKHRVCECK